MPARKLPAPSELQKLILTDGHTYDEVAEMYDVTPRNVHSTFRRDCERAGMTWPIPRRSAIDAHIRRGMQQTSVDATVIRELMREAYQDAREAYTASLDVVYVSSDLVRRAKTQPSLIVGYHTDGCPSLVKPKPVPVQLCQRRGYKPCPMCCELSVQVWSQRFPFSRQFIQALVAPSDSRRAKRISKKAARTLLATLGEQPHPTLLEWQPKRPKRVAA